MQTDYFFDGSENCETPSATILPVRGHITRVIERYPDGVDQQQRTAFDEFGNPTCRRTPQGEEIKYVYDETEHTYLTHIRNSFGHAGTYRYFGINGDVLAGGTYGQLSD